MLSMDQVLHGPRNPSWLAADLGLRNCVARPTSLHQPYAGRDNTRRARPTGFQLLRLAHALSSSLPLDPSRVAFSASQAG